jgi:endonuclease-8
MPEGDTIFRTARTLDRALGGKPITGFRSTFPWLARFHEDTPLTGQTVESVESRGKWVLIHFSGGGTLATHMLMSGSWHIYRPGERWQQPNINMRIVIENADYHAVGFRVPVVEMHTARSLARDRRIPGSAKDLLSNEFDAEAALRRLLALPHEEIGDVLLHQNVLAGVGNVFKSEVCFITGLNPFRRVQTLSPEQAAEAIAVARRQLGANVVENFAGSNANYRGPGRHTTNQLDPTASLWVYGRRGEPCRRCGETIRSRNQGPDARVTFWCPRCQPMPHDTEIDE